jgi:hypothetical protein
MAAFGTQEHCSALFSFGAFIDEEGTMAAIVIWVFYVVGPGTLTPLSASPAFLTENDCEVGLAAFYPNRRFDHSYVMACWPLPLDQYPPCSHWVHGGTCSKDQR